MSIEGKDNQSRAGKKKAGVRVRSTADKRRRSSKTHAQDPRVTLGTASFKMEWVRTGGAATCAPNPAYPEGVHLRYGPKSEKVRCCTMDLPYPAPGIGYHEVKCRVCGVSARCTTAGRADDPVKLTVPCYLREA